MLDHPGPFSEAQGGTIMAQNSTKKGPSWTEMALHNPKWPCMTPNGLKHFSWVWYMILCWTTMGPFQRPSGAVSKVRSGQCDPNIDRVPAWLEKSFKSKWIGEPDYPNTTLQPFPWDRWVGFMIKPGEVEKLLNWDEIFHWAINLPSNMQTMFRISFFRCCGFLIFLYLLDNFFLLIPQAWILYDLQRKRVEKCSMLSEAMAPFDIIGEESFPFETLKFRAKSKGIWIFHATKCRRGGPQLW